MAAPALNPGKPWHLKGASGRYAFEDRVGILLHYDASAADEGALSWLRSADCKLSYNWLIEDDGMQETIAPFDARAFHGGVCRSSDERLVYKDANWALYGIAIAATEGEVATEIQRKAVANLCVSLFQRHHWHRVNELWRIVGHDTEAWPRGRKRDPTGSNPLKPVLSVAEIRELVRSKRIIA